MPEVGSDDMRDGRDFAWLEMERAEKVPETVARTILRSIVEDGLVAGDRLPPEAAMLVQFGVGRASLREALRILETHGLIRIRSGPGGGPVVTDMQPSDYGQTTTLYLHRGGSTFKELLEARLIIEPVMARLAAQRLSADTADRLREATRLGWDAVEGSVELWSAASEAFHTVVASATENRVLDLFSGALVSIERQRLTTVFTEAETRKRTLRTHDRIAEAILMGDADRAEDLSRRHMTALSKLWKDAHARQMDDVIEWR